MLHDTTIFGTDSCRYLRLGVGRSFLDSRPVLHSAAHIRKRRLSNVPTFRLKIEHVICASVRGAALCMDARHGMQRDAASHASIEGAHETPSVLATRHPVSPSETGALRREFSRQRAASRCGVAVVRLRIFSPPPLPLPLRPGPYCITQKRLRLSRSEALGMQKGSGVSA